MILLEESGNSMTIDLGSWYAIVREIQGALVVKQMGMSLPSGRVHFHVSFFFIFLYSQVAVCQGISVSSSIVRCRKPRTADVLLDSLSPCSNEA